MLEWLIKRRIDAFEREYGYDTSYLRDMLAAARRGMPRALPARHRGLRPMHPARHHHGGALGDCARTRAVSLNTVYTHLRRIKEETGSKRMAELIHKLNDLQVPARID